VSLVAYGWKETASLVWAAVALLPAWLAAGATAVGFAAAVTCDAGVEMGPWVAMTSRTGATVAAAGAVGTAAAPPDAVLPVDGATVAAGPGPGGEQAATIGTRRQTTTR